MHDDQPRTITPDTLPEVVVRYLKAHAAHDTATAVSVFTGDATVIDDGNMYEGTAAIVGWLDRSATEFTYTTRLKTLVEDGLLERRPYQTNPVRHEYVLTELGHSLRPVIVALAAWGNSRLAPAERSMILVDAHTGEEVEPVVVDAGTGRRLDDSSAYVFTAGPAASDAMRDRYATAPGAPTEGK